MLELRIMFQSAAVMFKREPWWAEFWSAITAVFWAALSYASFHSLHDAPSMQVLEEIGNDQIWHLVGLVLGVSQMIFLVCDQRWMRWAAAVALCWFWGVLTLGVWTALPWAPAAAVYAGWCGINVFSILRLLRHYGP